MSYKGSRQETNIQEFKYRDTTNVECMIILVIIGATRIVTKGLKKNLEAMQQKHSVNSLQKTAILGTSHNMDNTAI